METIKNTHRDIKMHSRIRFLGQKLTIIKHDLFQPNISDIQTHKIYHSKEKKFANIFISHCDKLQQQQKNKGRRGENVWLYKTFVLIL